MGDTLRDLARKMRAATDEINEETGLALCTCHNHWDLDGVDPVELTHIFAGKKRAPLLRLHGAPYWAWISPDKDLPFVFEHGRMFAALSAGNGFELMNELDAYPRPRHNCPASYMELVDAVMRADQSTHGALKYMYDYTSPLGYETGYLDAHERDLPALEKLEKMFAAGEQAGVRVCVEPHLIAESDSDLTPPYTQMPRPIAGTMLTRCSIPTTYTGKGLCRAMLSRLMKRYHELSMTGDVFLFSQTFSYAAISIYQDFGFKRYLGEEPANWHVENFDESQKTAWQLIDEKIKAYKGKKA